MGETKKVKSAGRLGSRYGVGIRKRLLKIEAKQQRRYECPFCGFKRVKRKAAGIFACGKCHAKFAGGAYLPETLPGSIIKKTVAQKAFSNKALGEEIEKTLEETEEEAPAEKAGKKDRPKQGKKAEAKGG